MASPKPKTGIAPKSRQSWAMSPFGSPTLQPLLQRLFDNGVFERGDGLSTVFEGDLLAPIDIAETDKALVVTLEMPGLEAEDIHVRVQGDRLTISGEKHSRQETGGDDAEYHRVETSHGSFSRTISLPTNVNNDQIDADYAKGVLTVTLPKSQQSGATRVKVNAKD